MHLVIFSVGPDKGLRTLETEYIILNVYQKLRNLII